MRSLFQVHAKPPRPGTAKTRLGTEIGAERAAAFAGAFLRDTFALLRRAGVDAVLVTPEPGADHGVDAPVWDQGGGDLGERLERAYRRGLADAEVVVALGGDAPGLPAGHLRAVLALAERHDAVLGPAEDGGFWTLALRRCPDGVLAGLPWSAADTAAATAARFPGLATGPSWWDVDTRADLLRLRAEVDPAHAPATFALLARTPL